MFAVVVRWGLLHVWRVRGVLDGEERTGGRSVRAFFFRDWGRHIAFCSFLVWHGVLGFVN